MFVMSFIVQVGIIGFQCVVTNFAMHSINVKKLLKRPCSTSTLALIFTDHGAAESVSVRNF